MWTLMFHFGIILLLRVTVTTACHTMFDNSGNYSISPVDGNFWLNSGPFSFNLNGKWRSTAEGNLVIGNKTATTTGTDDIGVFNEDKWILTADTITMEAALRTYPDLSNTVVVFIQRFPQGLTGATTDVDRTISGYPTFQMKDYAQQPLGYLSYGSYMFGDVNKKAGLWSSKADVNDGLEGSGPLALFDGTGNAMVISALDNFMAASMYLNKNKTHVHYGIMGGVDSLPPGFQYRTIAYCSNTGIGDAFDGWGRIMRKVYNKTSESKEYHQTQDISLTHLGYWTDNGAFFYYNTEKNKTYEETLLDVKKEWTDKMTPLAYMQIDSWFYPKDDSTGVTIWDATENIFPNGIREFQDKLNLPLVAHNKYWSVNTIYATQNGGFFEFNIGKQMSLPSDQFFWEFLLGHGRVEWNLAVYEQDHLNEQFLESEFLTSDLHLARAWLLQMGMAALNRGIKIQYCMALPRHAYQSLEIPTVTQARVSKDYPADRNQWKIGVSSHFAHAMGVAPFKDTFWTTSVQHGNKYNKTEPYPTLQAVVATLSTGPVGPGDMIGGTNHSLLMQCCDEAGLILKPTKPARAIDDQLIEMAFANGTGVAGEVWTTFSINGDLLYGVIFSATLTKDYMITPQAAGFLSPFAANFTDSVIYSRSHKTLHPFTATSNFTIQVKECITNEEPFCLHYTAPILTFGVHQIVLLGDLNKFVPMSANRVAHIWQTSSGIAATLSGKPKEKITFTFAIDEVQFEETLAADDAGCATFTVISALSESFTGEEEFMENVDASNTTASSTTSSTVRTGTTWSPTLPPGYNCKFSPPPFTTPAATPAA